MKKKFCPDCIERQGAVELERYSIGPEGQEYQAEEGWQCPQCGYYSPDFPVGCLIVPALIVVIVVFFKVVYGL